MNLINKCLRIGIVRLRQQSVSIELKLQILSDDGQLSDMKEFERMLL
jgi:uncharacterized ubiquitin-like protein YukD